MPDFLTLKRPSVSTWRPILPLRFYTTAIEGQRATDTAQSLDSFALGSHEDPHTSREPLSEDGDKTEGNNDALDFILEGYETKRAPATRPVRKEQVKDTFAIYDAHVRIRGIRSGTSLKPSKKARSSNASRQLGRLQVQRRVSGPRQSRLEDALRRAPRAPALWGRPRWVSVASMGQYSPLALSRLWNCNYARAQNDYDRFQVKDAKMRKPPLLDPRAAELVEIVSQRMADNEDMGLQGLANKYNMEKSSVWAHIALWMLHYDKDCLVEFLLATGKSYSPGPWVADCLQVLAAHYRQSGSLEAVQYVEKLNRIFHMLSENPSGKGITFDGRYVRLVLPYSTTAQMIELHKAIKVGQFKVHANTMMHLTAYFAKHDHFHQALDVLLDAHRSGASVVSYPFRSNCSTLLRKAMNLPGGLRICLRIVDNLVKIGVTLNTRLCNIIILNAVEAGDVKTAHDIYRSLIENNVKADKYTHALLLKACKLVIDDADTLNHTITSAIEAVNVSRNKIVAVEILHCLALHHTRNSGDSSWSTICQAYAQIFDLDPLVKLGLPIPPSVQSTPRAKTPMTNVPPQAVGIMLRTYLYLIASGHGASTRAQTIYQRYVTLVDSGVKPFASTALTSYCYNAFLSAFIKNKRTLINAAEVIKDMQRASTTSPPTATAPDIQSWSIFLKGFTQHGQLRLAEQVLTYMRSKDMEPTAVTWNTLLAGYASQQDFDGLLDVVDRFDQSGHAWDEWTYNGLRRFRNSEQLKGAMEQRGKSVQLDFVSDLREGLEARLTETE